MSSIVLKRKYDMQLPINYVEVEKDEMEYIDGGAERVNYWWGYAINLTATECSATAKLLAGNIAAAGGLGAILGGPLAGAAVVIYSVGIGYTISVLEACADMGKGATLSKNLSGYSVNPW